MRPLRSQEPCKNTTPYQKKATVHAALLLTLSLYLKAKLQLVCEIYLD
jgi:hypothetical protein